MQRNLDARGWKPADFAREIRRQVGDGPSESAIGRWKNRGAAPTRESVEAVAAVFHRDPREALVAAGLVTAGELDAPWADPSHIDLTAVPDEALADEVVARLVRRRRAHSHPSYQPAASADGPSRTMITTTTAGSSRHTVPAGTTAAPPSSGEDEGAGRDTAHCA